MVQTLPVTPGKDYTVQAGDSLWTIAERAYGNGADWQKIYQANLQTIGKNASLISPGEVLHIPGTSPAVLTSHTSPASSASSAALAQPDLPLRTSTEIQGDILAGFNKDHRVYLFLRFPGQQNGRAWLKDLLPSIANTKDVAAFNALFSMTRHASGGKEPDNLKATWVNVSFTFTGLKLLLKTDPTAALKTLGFTSFVAGPEASAGPQQNGDTGPSDPKNWVVGRQDQVIHAFLNIQADDPKDLAAEVNKLKTLIAQHGVTIVREQAGETLPGELRGHEHFGYKDGISQPGVKGFDPADLSATKVDPTATLGYVQGHPGTEIIEAGEFILGEHTEPDGSGQFMPPSELSWMNKGSFQVFRRLNQDVANFDQEEQRKLDPLPSGDSLRSRIGALLVGRWKDGTPVDLSPDTNLALTGDNQINNFNFLARDVASIHVIDDPNGILRCPHFAHIRKVYPRNHGFAGNRSRRIIRRGVPFGNPFDPTRGQGFDAKAERGLLFVAYMSSIEDKFEFLMQVWVNSPDFPNGPGGAADPVIGNAPNASDSHIVLKHDGGQDVHIDNFQRNVQTTGTLYAFAPSIAALKGLANGTL